MLISFLGMVARIFVIGANFIRDCAQGELVMFFFSSRRRHTRLQGDWSSDVCSSDLVRLLRRVLSATSNVLRKVKVGSGAAASHRVMAGTDAETYGKYADELLRFAATLEIGRASCRESGERRGGGG